MKRVIYVLWVCGGVLFWYWAISREQETCLHTYSVGDKYFPTWGSAERYAKNLAHTKPKQKPKDIDYSYIVIRVDDIRQAVIRDGFLEIDKSPEEINAESY